MPTFKLDGQEIPFEPGETIIHAAWKKGIEIPHYCWHPGLSSPANCRMCLVEIKPAANQRPVMLDVLTWDPALGEYKPRQKPKLNPACQMACVEGQEVLADKSTEVAEARKAVQEFLLLNHPVDCPICDQSGECKLQDYWLEHQKTPKRMKDEPVHKPKGVVFGPTIVYDAERCVMCTRCIRFMEEVAKDPVLDMRERGNLNEITVAPGRQLDGHYTFMTEHVCPVGALTTKDFRFKARVWFLRTVKSVCQGCATGCNTHLDYDPRYNRAYRYRPRENMLVNKFWMCDDGMVTYKRAHEGRVLEPKVAAKTVSLKAALAEAKRKLGDVPKESLAIVFWAQHSLEDNWALRELAKLLGTKSFFKSGAPDGYADDILINKDKNPNTRGVVETAGESKPWTTFLDDIRAGRITHAIALGGPTSGEPGADREALDRLGALVTIASHEGALTENAAVLLPATSWAESNGTYVNAKGIRQTSDKAIEPQGSSRPAWELIRDLARALGLEPSWEKLKDTRERLPRSQSIPPPLGSRPPPAPSGGTLPSVPPRPPSTPSTGST